ncbi:hypothetical protein [Nonomuraea guangzhouensis]|uniref:Uncharacterized protein n=1 Tax=Nonomuraea guangzhouensis TaxID=1291555 RepID=A0ABW4G2L1_9ACTN|nr:hypothetical protein [Nonomuraea guangzhouensis]
MGKKKKKNKEFDELAGKVAGKIATITYGPAGVPAGLAPAAMGLLYLSDKQDLGRSKPAVEAVLDSFGLQLIGSDDYER